jgi:hypothetical protein
MGDAADDMMFREIGLPKTEFFTGKRIPEKLPLFPDEIWIGKIGGGCLWGATSPETHPDNPRYLKKTVFRDSALELLETLESLLSMVERQEDFNDDRDGCMIDNCHKIIAKARGTK